MPKIIRTAFIGVIIFQLLFSFDACHAETFDYKTYDKLLNKYVTDGAVDYLAWKKNDFSKFEAYIKLLEKMSVKGMTGDEEKAFWINAYNAVTIYAVLEHISNNKMLAKGFSVQMVGGFFDGKKYTVSGESLTLNDIENTKLREGFNDPRVHFAIVCASRSCPEIQNSVFEAKGLDERLDLAASIFIRDTRRNRIEIKRNKLYLSEIFDWYSEDFINVAGSITGYVKKYLEKKYKDYLEDHDVKVKYLGYNWFVNIKK